MKTSQAVIIIIVIVLLGAFAFMWSGKNGTTVINNPPVTIEEQVPKIEGCYLATTGKDVYTLKINSQSGDNFVGNLSFKNFEKDSSSGTYVGTYENGILLGDYTFQSEGTTSVMQVIFKKSGDSFVRGYGDVNADGTRFTDLNNVAYDSSSTLSLFEKGDCQ